MPDGLVDLKRELRRVENDIELAFRTLRSRVQRDRLLSSFAGMFQQPQLLDQFIPSALELAAVRVGIRALLDLRTLERIRCVTRSGSDRSLVYLGTLRRVEPLLIAAKVHAGLGQSHALHRQQGGVNGEQQIQIFFDGDAERINLAGRRDRKSV